jgi:TP901 family phage tail tape measure protein
MAFNITGRIVLQGPANVQQITSQIQSQLGSISTQIKVDLSPASIAAINQLTVSVNQLNANVGNLNVSLGGVAVTAQRTGASLSAVNAPLTQLGTTANQTSKALVQIDTISKQAGDSVAYFGEQSALATRRFLAFSIAAGALIGTIAAIKSGISDAITFQNEMIKLAQVSNDSASQIRGVANEITNLSQRYGVSSRELAQASVTLRQAGYSAEEVKKALESLSQAALSPNFDTFEKNTQGAIAVMSQFKLNASQLSASMSAINSVAAEFAVSAKDIQDGVIRAGGAFSAIGGNLNEFIALFTSVKHTTQESAEAVSTGLRTIFSRLQSRATLDSLQAMQIQLRYTAQEARALGNINLTNQFIGPFQAVQRIGDALRALPSTDQRYANIVEAIGGTRNVSRALPLIQDRDQQGRSIQQRALDIANNSGLSLSSSAEKGLESLSRQASIVFEKFQEFYRLIGDSSGFQTLARSLLQVAGGFAEVLKVAAPIVPLFTVLAATNIVSGGIRFGQAFADKISTPHFAPIAQQTPRFAGGGYASGGLSALTPGEAVFSPAQTSSIGVNALNHLNSGGSGFMVPGVGNQDSELYNLAAGSYVIRKDSVNKIGKNTLKYAQGGYNEQEELEKHFANLISGNTGSKQESERIKRIKTLAASHIDSITNFGGPRSELGSNNFAGFAEGGQPDTVASLLKQIEETKKAQSQPKGILSGLASILGYNRDGVTVQESVNLSSADEKEAQQFAQRNLVATMKQLQFKLAELGVNKGVSVLDLGGSDGAILRQAGATNPEFNRLAGSLQTYFQDAITLTNQGNLKSGLPDLLKNQAQLDNIIKQVRAYKRGQSTSFSPSVDIPTAGRAGSLEGILGSVAPLDRSIFPYDIPTAQLAPPVASIAPPIAEIAPIPTAKIINDAGKGRKGRVAEAESYVVSALAAGVDEAQIYANLITNYGLAPSTAKIRLRNAKKSGRDAVPIGIPVADIAPPQFARGGLSSRDTIPAMLTPGEFVFSPEAVSRIGVANLDRVNKGGTVDHIRGYNRGGVVKGYADGDKITIGDDKVGVSLSDNDLRNLLAAYSSAKEAKKGTPSSTVAGVQLAQQLSLYFNNESAKDRGNSGQYVGQQNIVVAEVQRAMNLSLRRAQVLTKEARENPLVPYGPDLPPDILAAKAEEQARLQRMADEYHSPVSPRDIPPTGTPRSKLLYDPNQPYGIPTYYGDRPRLPDEDDRISKVLYKKQGSLQVGPFDNTPALNGLITTSGAAYGIPADLGNRPALGNFSRNPLSLPLVDAGYKELPQSVQNITKQQAELEKFYRKQVEVTSKGLSEEEKKFLTQKKINTLIDSALVIEQNKFQINHFSQQAHEALKVGLDNPQARESYINALREKNARLEQNFNLTKTLEIDKDVNGGINSVGGQGGGIGAGFFGRLFGKGSPDEATLARRQFGATTALVASSYLGDALSRAGGTSDEAARNGTGSSYGLGRAFSIASIYGGIGLGLGGLPGATIGAVGGAIGGTVESLKELKIATFGLEVERSVQALNNLTSTVDRLGQRLNASQVQQQRGLIGSAIEAATSQYETRQGGVASRAYSVFEELNQGQSFSGALDRSRIRANSTVTPSDSAFLATSENDQQRYTRLSSINRESPAISASIDRRLRDFVRNQRIANPNITAEQLSTNVNREFNTSRNGGVTEADILANSRGVRASIGTNIRTRREEVIQSAGSRFLSSPEGLAATNQAETRQLILSGTISATHDLEIGLRRFNTSINQTADSMESLGKDLNSLTSLISGGGQLTRYNASTSLLSRPLDTPDYRNAVIGVTGGLGPVGDTLRTSGLLAGRLSSIAPDLLRRYINNVDSHGQNPELERRTLSALDIEPNSNSQEARIVRNFTSRLNQASQQDPQRFFNSGTAREDLVRQELGTLNSPLGDLAAIQERIINQQIAAQQRILDLYKQRAEHISRAVDAEADFAKLAAQQGSIRQFGSADAGINRLTDRQVNAGFYSRINELGRPVGVNDRTSLQDIGVIGTQAVEGRRRALNDNNLSPDNRSSAINRFDAQLRSVIDVLRIYENSTQRVAFVNEQLAQNSRERSSRIEGQRRLILGSDEDRAESAFGASIFQYVRSQGDEQNRQTTFNQLGLPGQQSYLRYADQFADVRFDGTRSIRDEANARVQGRIGSDIINPLNAAQDNLIEQMRSLSAEQAQANGVMGQLIQVTSDDVRSVQLIANTEALRILTEAIRGYSSTQRIPQGGIFSRGTYEPDINPPPSSTYARGGVVYASNGIFQPQGTDTVPAMLTPGEMVVNAASTAANRELLEHINNLKGPINKTLYRPIGGAVYAEVDARREEERRAAAIRANNPNYIDVGGRTPFEVTPAVAGYYSRDNSNNAVYDPNTRKQIVYRADGGSIEDPRLTLFRNGPALTPRQLFEQAENNRRDSVGDESRFGDRERIRAAFEAVENSRRQSIGDNPLVTDDDRARIRARFLEVEARRQESVLPDAPATAVAGPLENNNELRAFRGQFNPLGFQNDINQIGGAGAAANYQALANQNLLRQQLLGQTQTSGAFGGAFGGQLGFGQRQGQAAGLGTLASLNRRFLTQQPLFGSPNNLLLNNLRTRRYATGGHVDGPSGTDTIPAYLSNGEYVMSAGATRSIGPQNLAQIQRFAEGGLVGNTGSAGVGGALGNPELTAALLKFSSESGTLSAALLSFSQQNQELVEAMKAFPHTITMTATHNVNVTHNGADVFATLEPEFKDLAVSTTKEELSKFIKDKFPDLA